MWSITVRGGVLHIWTVLLAVHQAASQSVLWNWTFINELTNSFKTLHISKRDFSDPIAFIDIRKYAKRAAVQISTMVVWAHHAGCQNVLSNRIFWNIYLNTFFGVLNFGNKSTMRFFFFWKALKILSRCKKKLSKNFLFLR